MAQITSKELSALSDLLTVEQNLIAKYTDFSNQTHDTALQNKFQQLAARHQTHFDELFSSLK